MFKNHFALLFLALPFTAIVAAPSSVGADTLSDSAPAYLLFAFDGSDRGGLDLYTSRDGLAWRTLATGAYVPALGEWRIFRDPCVHLDDEGVFHLVWTTGASGFGYARSTDAINWTHERYIRVADPARGLDFQNVWAPFLHVEKDLVRVLWSSTLRSDYRPPADPREWWHATWNHRLYSATTRDWETYTPTEKFWDPGFNVIDAKLYRRDSDDYLLFYKDERREAKHVLIAHAASPSGPFIHSRQLTPRFTEGAIVLRRAPGDYLLYYDRYTDEQGYAALPSRDLDTFGDAIVPTKDASSRVQRHGSIVTLTPLKLAAVHAAQAAHTHGVSPVMERMETSR